LKREIQASRKEIKDFVEEKLAKMAEAIQKSIKESNRDQGKPLKKHHSN